MQGAKAEETWAGELVAKLAEPAVSAWTVAELLVLGDQAVAALEEFVSLCHPPPDELRELAVAILEAIRAPAVDIHLKWSGDGGMKAISGRLK